MSETLPTPQTSTDKLSPEELELVSEQLFKLGQMAVAFARVERAPRLPDGRRETDVEHSFHLALSATELAARFFPNLDVGLVSQFSNIHDFPEIYTGDVWTFAISDEERAKKEAAEAESTERLLGELPPYTASLLKRYEEQKEPEARFVRYVDKIMPAIINMLSHENNTFLNDHDVTNVEQLREHRARNTERFQKMFPEFPLLHQIRQAVSTMSEHHFFPPKS